MVQVVRTIACVLVATLLALVGLVWLQTPRTSAKPSRQLLSTYDTAVGLVDLYLRDDHRGFERLVDVDPLLTGVGGRAAKTVSAGSQFGIDERVAATRLLAERNALDDSFAQDLATSITEQGHTSAFCAIEEGLDLQLGCAS